MRAGRAGGLLALALAAPAASAAAGRLAIEHVPVECVAYERYTRIAARGVPGDDVASAQLQFRAAGGGGWYSVGMAADGTEWAAFLPRPIRPLTGVEYRIVLRGSDAGEATTPSVSVPAREECADGGRSAAAVEAPIVVRVPKGAPLVPPVPAGFSPAGVVAAEERARPSTVKTLAVGAGLLGAVGATVALADGAEGPPPELTGTPSFAFVGTAPVAGSTLSLARRDPLTVMVLVSGDARGPLSLSWTVQLLGAGGETVCATMGGSLFVFLVPPYTMYLTAPLLRSGACGERFEVDRARLHVSVSGRPAFDTVQAVPFRFEP